MPISAWISPLGISFGHQVADDAKTGSGTTEKHENQGFLGELAGEPGFEPRLTESESVVLPLNYSPPRVSPRRSVSGLIAKTSGIAKTEFQKNDSFHKRRLKRGCKPSEEGGGRPLAAGPDALSDPVEKPFGAPGRRWYALSNETNDDTCGMRRFWRLARCSGKLQ